MNKQFYRTKFNAKLGTYVAVSELAKSHQGDTSPRVKSTIDPQNQGGGSEHITDATNTGQRTLRQLVLALSSLMAITPIYANVTVNKNAAAAHQATVLKAGNAANVWITAPSASGVSRNSYTQFDVNQNGVILNNSRGAATSQITKTSIAANPNLAKGAATTIVNEVVSSNPSLLQGNLEVLGSRANVVIANPTGITVNGGGFINANQVTLSTGALSYNSDGSIKQHTVKQGAIIINPDVNKRGLGGNANNPIALELLGRSIAINAPVNADTITAVTGANTIVADTNEITTTTGSGTKPTVAIDVAQLGGLYANSIYLYANEAGVGVNNAGVIQAQNNVVLTSKGKIEHQGTISSTSKTQGLVSISTTGTGVAGDINSSGSINSYGILSIDAGNDINVKAKDITLNYGGATSSPLMLNANGSLNLAASTKVSNLGNLGDLYIDAKNITLGSGSELRSNRGSAMIQANQNLISNKGGFVAAKDLSLFGNTNLKLTDTRLHASTGDINLQSSLKDSSTNNINVQGGSVYALKGLNVYSDQDITLNNINFLKKTDSTLAQINSLNVYAGNNLSFTTANQVFPYTAGKIQLGAGNVLTVQGMGTRSTLKGGGGLNLSGKSVTTKNIQLASSGAQDLDIISNGGNILLDQGTNLWANTGNINVNAVNGSITANSLQATTLGKTSLVASKNVILAANKVETAVTGTDAKNVKYTPSKITAEKGIYVASIDNGYLRLNTISLDAKNGDIQLDAKKGSISLLRSDEVTQQKNADGSFSPKKTYLWSELNGKNILINSGTNNSLLWGNLTSTGNIQVQAKGTQYLYGLNLKSGANTTLHSDGRQTLHSITGQSNGHIALSTDDRLYLNSSIVTADGTTSWASGGTVKLQTDGVLSLVSGAGHYLQNTDLKGGAVLIESGAGFDVNKNVKVTAVGSSILNNDKGLKNLNGNLSIQTHDDLTIDPKLLTLNAAGDYDLTSKNSDLTLLGYGGTNGNGSEQVVNLKTVNGGINLAGQKVELQGSQLNAAKDISIVSTAGDLIVDGIRNSITNQHTDEYKENVIKLDNEIKELQKTSEYEAMIAFFLQEVVKISEKVSSGELKDGSPEMEREFERALRNTTKEYPEYLSKYGELRDEKDFYSEMIKLFNVGYVNGEVHAGAKIISDKGDIRLVSKKGLSISGSSIDAKVGKINLEAAGTLDGVGHNIQGNYNNTTENSVKKGIIKGSIIIDANQDSYEQGIPSDKDYRWFSPVSATSINGSKGVSIKATGKQATDNLILQGVAITSDNDVNIEAYKNIIFDVAINNSFNKSQKTETKRKWYGKKKTITTTQTAEKSGGLSVDINAKNINIKSQEKNTSAMTGQLRTSIDMYSSKFTAIDGKLNIQAGGDLNFLTADDVSLSTTDISKKSSFLGVKLNKSHTTNTRNVKSELPAVLNANYIGTKSGFDTRLKGTVFNYLDGANIQAGGNIILEGASTTVTETLKKESNSVVWQSMQDKGSITEIAQLPSFNGPVAPKFEAKGGLTVQVPVVSGKNNDVTAEIIKLSKQPGNEYLKSLIARKDVNWEAVKLAQENWDYKSQGLTGAGAAIIVLIVTVLTSGAGAAAATSVTSATGVASLGVGAQAAVTTLASQASVSLINNGGDITKTLKDLGSKDSVRNLATSVVTAGLLSQVGASLNLKPDSAYFPDRLMNNFTNTVGSTLVQTAINGGDLQSNLEKALLAGLAGALQGELASQIGKSLDKVDPNAYEYLFHKIAHAAAGCATAAVTKASCEAGAIGAGVGEIVAGLMIPEGKNALDLTDAERASIKNTSKIVAGSVAAFAGYDVNTAANSANIAVENNTLGKLLTTTGKGLYKVAKKITDMPAAVRANLKPSEIAEMLRKEGVQGVIDIGDNITTLVSPTSTVGDRAFALIDLAIGVDLKAGKNVDVLKAEQKILVKNLGTSSTKNAIIEAAKKSDIKSFELPVNGKLFKPDPSVSSGAAVYKGASNDDIYTAFKEIAGIRTLPSTGSPMYQTIKGKTSLSGQPGYIIRVPQEDGSTVLLRNFSLTQNESKARFTIDIQKPAGMKVNKLELKFQ